MAQIINAIYEEGVLKPLEPLDIKEHTKVRIIIESEKDRKRPPLNFPVDSYGSWPKNLSLRREDIYDESGKVVKRGYDSDGDMKVDKWQTYDGNTGTPIVVESDRAFLLQ